MSYFAAFDGVAGPDVATNSGWREFGQWLSEMEGVDALRHLAEYGWSDNIRQVESDLSAVLEMDGLPPDHAGITRGLLRALDGQEDDAVLAISDGTGEGQRGGQ